MNAPIERRPLLMPPLLLRDTGDSAARFALGLACNAALALDRRMPEARAVAGWLSQFAQSFGLDDSALPDEDAESRGRRPDLSAEDWRTLLAALEHAAAPHAAAAPDTADRWIAAITDAIGLPPAGRAILTLALRYELDVRVERLFDTLAQCRGAPDRLHRIPALLAMLLGLPQAELAPMLDARAPLLDSGILGLDRRGGLYALHSLFPLIRQDVPPGADIHAQLLGAVPEAPLPWESFAHLGREAEVAADLLRAALAGRERGIGILLHGAPGTGKTSFAATLAARAGARLRPIGEAGWDGDEPERAERLSALRLAHRLAAPGDALLFDEAEDLFVRRAMADGEAMASSRVFIHRVLEQGTAPVIWTANDTGALGPAVLRRMTMCIELKVPGPAARARLWQSMGTAAGVELPDADAARLARLVPAAPAVAATALRATRLAGGGAVTTRLVVEGTTRAVLGGALPLPDPAPDGLYDPALINADSDLAALAARLAAPDAPRAISMLIAGPPGAGKSAWVRHLADQMGLPVLQKRASDLLNMYVGGTEQRIAAAFAEARDTGAFLVFDEADSLLLERGDATRSWEITQVNEMLTWMEAHPLPVACITNLRDRLDRASLRRFLVKLRFDWLTTDQARLAWRRFLDGEPPPALDTIRTLTPADFALVRRRAALEPGADVLRLLTAEAEGRVGGRGAIGF